MSSVFTIAEDYEMVDANPVLPFLRVQRRRIFDVEQGTCEEVEGVSMAR
mgnify:CR=1 FL=1